MILVCAVELEAGRNSLVVGQAPFTPDRVLLLRHSTVQQTYRYVLLRDQLRDRLGVSDIRAENDRATILIAMTNIVIADELISLRVIET